MSIATLPRIETSKSAFASTAARPLRIGILGLGNVGQAVARQLAAAARVFEAARLRPIIVAALVRDAQRPRDLLPEARVIRLVDHVETFLAQPFDVVVEVLGGASPAFEVVSHLLRRGVAVVTANKSLLAAHGEELNRIARRGGAPLLCEASALAGVPVLNTLRERPLAARVTRLAGIVNGTSNFVLSRVDRHGESVETAVRDAIRLGLAEPDPTFDLSGRDAAEKLIIVLQHLRLAARRDEMETNGIAGLLPDDLLQARTFGGVIKSIVSAEIENQRVAAFAGPCWIPATHALARLDAQQCGLCISGPDIGDLAFIGPGAGPAVTAGTIVDDVIAAARVQPSAWTGLNTRPAQIVEAHTGWLLRTTFERGKTRLEALGSILSAAGVRLRGLFGIRSDTNVERLYALARPCPRRQIETALAQADTALECESSAIRAITD